MGMGEPLHNYDATMKALRMLADEHGLAVSPRRVTLSTVGVLPALERLAREPLMPNLAISLHATTDEQRDELVPINRKYGVDGHPRRLPAVPAEAAQPHHVRVRAARGRERLAGGRAPAGALLAGIKAKVNLIPLNAAPGIPFERPSDERVDRFAQILADHGLTVSVRKSRGRDIRAACGQLIVEGRAEISRRSSSRAASMLTSIASSTSPVADLTRSTLRARPGGIRTFR